MGVRSGDGDVTYGVSMERHNMNVILELGSLAERLGNSARRVLFLPIRIELD